jgi:hypothetical protein
MLHNPTYKGEAAFGKTVLEPLRPRLGAQRGRSLQHKHAYSHHDVPAEQWMRITVASYAEGLIDKGEFEPRIARMRERLKQIEEQAQQVKDVASLEREMTLILGRLEAFAARVQTGLHEADWLTRREIIRALVKRVEIDRNRSVSSSA